MDKGLTKLQEELKPTVGDLIVDQTKYDPFKDDSYLTEGTFLLNRFSEAKKKIEDQRIAFTKPLNESLRSINGFFKTFSDPIKQADDELRQKLAEHRHQLEAKRIAAQNTANDLGLEVPDDLRKKIGGVVVKKAWTFEVEDKSKIPNEFLMIDEVKIRAAIRAGVRTMSGIKIYQKDVVSL
jgi:hypothetical protein